MFVGFKPEESPESSFKGETTFMFFVWKEFFTSAKIHTGVRDHMCFECEKTFITSEYFKRHQRIYTGEKPYNFICEIQINSKMEFLPKEQYLKVVFLHLILLHDINDIIVFSSSFIHHFS